MLEMAQKRQIYMALDYYTNLYLILFFHLPSPQLPAQKETEDRFSVSRACSWRSHCRIATAASPPSEVRNQENFFSLL